MPIPGLAPTVTPQAVSARDIKAKAGYFTWTTVAAGNTIAVTGVGFQPKVVLFFSGSPATVDSVGGGSSARTIGFAVSSTKRWGVATYDTDAVGTSDNGKQQYNDAIIKGMNGPASLERALDFVSMDSDGFTVIVDDALATQRSVFYLALGGSDLTDADIVQVTEAAATGDQDITSLAFQPDFILHLHSSSATINGFDINSAMGWGAANGSGQFTAYDNSPDASTTSDNWGYLRYDEFFTNALTGSPLTVRATFSQFLSNGFRLNWSERNGSRVFGTLALKGVLTKIGSMSTRTDGNNIVVSGLGFTPKAVMFIGHGIPESTADLPNNAWEKFSLGFATGPTERVAYMLRNQDNVGTMNIGSGIEHDEAYAMMQSSADSIEALMDIVSFDADGFTCVMDDVDAAATNLTYIAFG